MRIFLVSLLLVTIQAFVLPVWRQQQQQQLQPMRMNVAPRKAADKDEDNIGSKETKRSRPEQPEYDVEPIFGDLQSPVTLTAIGFGLIAAPNDSRRDKLEMSVSLSVRVQNTGEKECLGRRTPIEDEVYERH